MTTCVRGAILAGLFVTLLAAPALGNGWRSRSASYYSGYYAPVAVGTSYFQPVYVIPSAAVCVPNVQNTTPAALPVELSTYAQPTSAPPSQTNEPPLDKPDGKRPPKVSESRSNSTSFVDVSADTGKPARERHPVGFWNVSNKDVVLTVAGQTRLLPRNRSITLELEREFTWHVDQQPRQQARVPAERTGMEIVIR